MHIFAENFLNILNKLVNKPRNLMEMKRIINILIRFFSYSVIIVVVFSATIASCNKDEDNKTGPEVMQISIADAYTVSLGISGTGTATVDWGDGSKKETKMLSSDFDNLTFFTHEYSDESARTIIIYGENITGLVCDGYYLKSIDVSKNTALIRLSCCCGELTSLDVSNNTALEWLSCSANQLTQLDLSKNTALKFLYCSGNSLTNLDVSANTALTRLACSTNQLTSLDVSKNTELQALLCNFNALSELDISQNLALTLLGCVNNQLVNLDVSKNTALTQLNCHGNRLESLNVGDNIMLEYLICNGNELTSLEIGNNSVMKVLFCDENQLSNLDVSGATALHNLWISDNKFSVEALNGLFGTLHNDYFSGGKFIKIGNNPGTVNSDQTIATDKGWTVELD